MGLASYLLIGFWYFKPSAAAAAKKAFVVNRVGDMGLAIALMVLFATVGSIGYQEVFTAAPGMSDGALTAVGLLLLLAACGKSAQVPLQSWLGDAMEGPPGLGAHPRRHHGDRRCVPDRALRPGVQPGTRSPDRGGRRRCGDTAVRRDHRLRQGRHQEGIGRLDDEPDRLHGACRRSRPAGYPVAIMHLLTLDSSRPACSSAPDR